MDVVGWIVAPENMPTWNVTLFVVRIFADVIRWGSWDEIILNWGGLQISYKTGPYKTRKGERYRHTEKAMRRWSQIGLCSQELLAAPEARTETSSNSPSVLPEGSTSLITWIQISGLQNYYSINFCCFKGAFVVIYHDNLRKHIQWGVVKWNILHIGRSVLFKARIGKPKPEGQMAADCFCK